jgi:ribulose-5-phosphate 4-epimerase/fuculose-1-phosphate aldolase
LRKIGGTKPAGKNDVAGIVDVLVEWCGRAGGDPRMVQGGGGNVSVKAGELMFVKASGWTFLSLCNPDGFAVMRYAPVAALFTRSRNGRKPSDEDYTGVLAANLEKGSPAPSIESAMHAMLGAVVCHTHPTALLRVLCRRGARGRITGIMNDIGVPWLMVPYANPGAALAAAVVRSAKAAGINLRKQPLALFLKNHGLVTVDGTPAGATGLTERIVAGFDRGPCGAVSRPAAAKSGGSGGNSGLSQALIAALDEMLAGEGCWREADRSLSQAICGAVLGGRLPADRSLFPDQAVYCGQAVLVLSGTKRNVWEAAWDEYVSRRGIAPSTVIHRGGVLALRSSSDAQFNAQSETWGCVGDVCMEGEGDLVFIPGKQVLALTGCKQERNRQRYIMSREAAMAFQRR